MPENYKKPWTLEDLTILALVTQNKANRKILANALKRTEAAIDYAWYNMGRSKKSWREEFPEGLDTNEYYQNIQKARKIVGLTRVYTPKSSDEA